MVLSKGPVADDQNFLVNILTVAAYIWSIVAPDCPTYGLTKNAGTALLQQVAKDSRPDDMQIISFHPGGVLTESARNEGCAEGSFDFDDEDLPWNFAVWAASPEATFFAWTEDEHFLKVSIEGLSEKDGGARF
ncbi:uncharacterized protein PpBr36_10189 [Pyricularia pennisetigena]|uniref:uncharacterized protein n=1 Tax=Pyricularia pennisetigena TaxID=1578925 RepID=UPI00115246DC|nr:uncharacterized protein PpBr36_10189 [Pyricularia pennisetigena]TLS21335.1 hypothetical protein PpBr36_10189 [Pyricularia pennisetigena]